MATHRAISAVSNGIVNLLANQYTAEAFDGNQLQFKVYLAKDFAKPMEAGVSVFLYRIYTNHTYRTPPGRLDANGQRQRPQLPLDLHFLLTAWAQDASLQHTIAAWMMRVLEDTPSLPAGLLNQGQGGSPGLGGSPGSGAVFHSDETVEIGLAELGTEEFFRIWEVIVNHAYQISVPYLARMVKIESLQASSAGQPVQERDFNMAKPLEG